MEWSVHVGLGPRKESELQEAQYTTSDDPNPIKKSEVLVREPVAKRTRLGCLWARPRTMVLAVLDTRISSLCSNTNNGNKVQEHVRRTILFTPAPRREHHLSARTKMAAKHKNRSIKSGTNGCLYILPLFQGVSRFDKTA